MYLLGGVEVLVIATFFITKKPVCILIVTKYLRFIYISDLLVK